MAGLVRRLQDAGFAHGELSPDNVLVEPGGRLRLVDLDSAWIPQLDGAPPAPRIPAGAPSWGWHDRVWDRWTDTFPGLVTHTSLVVVARRPELWRRFGHRELIGNLLFHRRDFGALRTRIWTALDATGDAVIARAAARLERCRVPQWRATGPLDALLSDDCAPRRARRGGVFVCYRRDDAAYAAAVLSDVLGARLGRDRVFTDVDSLAPGDDFAPAVAEAIAACDVALVLIGRHWLAATGDDGRRRLDDPDDPVRREIELALRHGIRIVPVLLDAVLPAAEQLPPSLASLPSRQAVTVRASRVRPDVEDLIGFLDRTGSMPQPPDDPEER